MPARVVLAVCAALVLAWVGVLVRDHYVGQSGAEKLLYQSSLSEPEFQRNLDRLSDSRFLNPGTTAELARGQYYLFHGRPRDAARSAEQLVRSEPENADAWRLLWQATRETDPARAAEAEAELKRLNPLASL
jgi:predicted Zn-dependent protease